MSASGAAPRDSFSSSSCFPARTRSIIRERSVLNFAWLAALRHGAYRPGFSLGDEAEVPRACDEHVVDEDRRIAGDAESVGERRGSEVFADEARLPRVFRHDLLHQQTCRIGEVSGVGPADECHRDRRRGRRGKGRRRRERFVVGGQDSRRGSRSRSPPRPRNRRRPPPARRTGRRRTRREGRRRAAASRFRSIRPAPLRRGDHRELLHRVEVLVQRPRAASQRRARRRASMSH